MNKLSRGNFEEVPMRFKGLNNYLNDNLNKDTSVDVIGKELTKGTQSNNLEIKKSVKVSNDEGDYDENVVGAVAFYLMKYIVMNNYDKNEHLLVISREYEGKIMMLIKLLSDIVSDVMMDEDEYYSIKIVMDSDKSEIHYEYYIINEYRDKIDIKGDNNLFLLCIECFLLIQKLSDKVVHVENDVVKLMYEIKNYLKDLTVNGNVYESTSVISEYYGQLLYVAQKIKMNRDEETLEKDFDNTLYVGDSAPTNQTIKTSHGNNISKLIDVANVWNI